MAVTHDDVTVTWLGYATVRLEAANTVVYFDPGRYGVLDGTWQAPSDRAATAHPRSHDHRPEDADLVCLTHVHHYDPDGIDRVAAADATVLAFEGINVRDSSRDLPRLSDIDHDVRTVGTEADVVAADRPVWTVPAYNHPDGPHTRADGSPIHPEGLGCGFLLSLDGTTVFWPGDTDVLAGHAELDVDVFLPPIGGSFTMDRDAAAALAVEMEPDLVVPVHYNTFGALEADSESFVADLRGSVPVALDESSGV